LERGGGGGVGGRWVARGGGGWWGGLGGGTIGQRHRRRTDVGRTIDATPGVGGPPVVRGSARWSSHTGGHSTASQRLRRRSPERRVPCSLPRRRPRQFPDGPTVLPVVAPHTKPHTVRSGEGARQATRPPSRSFRERRFLGRAGAPRCPRRWCDPCSESKASRKPPTARVESAIMRLHGSLLSWRDRAACRATGKRRPSIEQ